MTWVGTEIEEVVVPLPAVTAAVGVYVYTHSQRGGGFNIPDYGTVIPVNPAYYSILHTPSQTAKVYSGSGWARIDGALGAEGLIWLTGNNSGLTGSTQITSINPATGEYRHHGGRSNIASAWCYSGGWVFRALSSQVEALNTTTLQWTSFVNHEFSYGARGAAGGLWWSVTGGLVRAMDPSQEGFPVVSTTPTQHTPTGVTGVTIGDIIVWRDSANTIWRLNTLSQQVDMVQMSPTGCPSASLSCVDNNGYIYGLDSSDPDRMVVVNPWTGQWAVRQLPTARPYRGQPVYANGLVWVPSGDPRLYRDDWEG